MKKNEVVKEVSKRSGLPKAECDKVVDTFIDVIRDALVDDGKVIIRGFLTLETSELKARNGYNPITGQLEQYAPVKIVKCKVGRPIKDAVNDFVSEE